MTQEKTSKSCSKRKMEVDRISNLPSDIIAQILSCLTIKEAVQTSVLSSRWRFKSAIIPRLVFKDECFKPQNHKAFERIVDRVLLLHIGPIQSFKLSCESCPNQASRDHVDRWILHLSRNAVKEFILDIFGDPYKMSSSLFSCQDIVKLELFNCLLKPPSTFKGFRSLKSLNIEEVTIAQHFFDDLIVSCPLLEWLALAQCKGFTCLNIDAPNLKFFAFNGFFEHMYLKNTLNLAEVHIYWEVWNDYTCPASCSHLVNVFVDLPRIRRLSIQNLFLQYLAVGTLPGKMHKSCLNLNFLSMSVDFRNSEQVSAAEYLLRSSPALQELEIETSREDQDVIREAKILNFWLDDNQDCLFTQLRVVKVTGISNVKAQLDLIQFLLSSSPVLESMTVSPASADSSVELLKKLMRFRRASAHSELIYLDRWSRGSSKNLSS